MPRKLRIIYPGYYHIINRGVDKKNIFVESDDYEHFLELLEKIKTNFNITIHCFCLMTNHYHILIQTHEENISDAIRYLNSNYSIYFNKKYTRTGHLWQGRFHSYFLYDDTHFWLVAKYIERNPIKANMQKHINQYKYQSYFQWKNKHTYYELLEGSQIFDMTLKEYEDFIKNDLDFESLEKVYVTPKIIKTDDGDIKILYKRLETFFEEDRDINRNKNINKAYVYGYTKTEISNLLNLSSKMVSKIII